MVTKTKIAAKVELSWSTGKNKKAGRGVSKALISRRPGVIRDNDLSSSDQSRASVSLSFSLCVSLSLLPLLLLLQLHQLPEVLCGMCVAFVVVAVKLLASRLRGLALLTGADVGSAVFSPHFI